MKKRGGEEIGERRARERKGRGRGKGRVGET